MQLWFLPKALFCFIAYRLRSLSNETLNLITARDFYIRISKIVMRTYSKKIPRIYANRIAQSLWQHWKNEFLEWKRNESGRIEVKVERVTESSSKVKSIIWFIKPWVILWARKRGNARESDIQKDGRKIDLLESSTAVFSIVVRDGRYFNAISWIVLAFALDSPEVKTFLSIFWSLSWNSVAYWQNHINFQMRSLSKLNFLALTFLIYERRFPFDWKNLFQSSKRILCRFVDFHLLLTKTNSILSKLFFLAEGCQ